jgi:UTP--glucose-1-phosphate uridylyltransferase
MKITKAVITAAARSQRTLPLQTLVDRDGMQKPVLNIIVEEALDSGVESIAVVVCTGDETAYRQAAGQHADKLHFVAQKESLGYGHAIYCARDFVGDEPFLHMVGDHVYTSDSNRGCARQLVEVASEYSCSVSGVQPTRENLLPLFGAVGGQRVKGTHDRYQIDCVAEKPTPTQAEQSLMIPGLRSGHYLCFFGMHVFTPTVMELLQTHVEASEENRSVQLSPVLSELAGRERYMALEVQGRRYPVDVRYGLLTAQLALALAGQDREEVLSGLCEMLAQRHPKVSPEHS